MCLVPAVVPVWCVSCYCSQGMLRSVVVGQFYKDLVNPDYETAFAIYHR